MRISPALLLPLLLACARQPLRSQPSSEAANTHACELFQLFRQMTPGNFCFSPYSSHQMAALLTAGAKGETQTELAKAAHLGADPAKGVENTAALRAALAVSASRGTLSLEINNSLWAPESGGGYQPAFLDAARAQIGVSVEKLPMGDATACAATVNRWVREKTRGRTAQVVGPAAFANPGQTVLAVNTVYLKGVWSDPFNPKLTQMRAFQSAAQGTVMRPTMRMPQGSYRYSESDTCQCLSLPMSGGASLLVLLPRTEVLRQTIETRLTPASYQAVLQDLKAAEVNTQLPRFSYSTQLSLKALWQSLGARAVFEPGRADLSPALSLPGAYVSDVQHEASIDINESGAVAAAVTTAAADPFGDPPKQEQAPRIKTFIANRPFLWMVRHNTTDLILFMGRYAGD